MFHLSGGTEERALYGSLEQDPIKTMHCHLKWALGAASVVLLASIATTIALVESSHLLH